MKKPLVLFCTLCLVIVSFSGCKTATGELPPGAQPIWISDVLAGGAIMQASLELISSLDPEIGENVVQSLIRDINDDPTLTLYWVPSGNNTVDQISYDTSAMNGSLVFSQYSLKRTSAAMKKAARAGQAGLAAEDVQTDESIELTDEEKAALSQKAGEFDDDERAELKRCLIYLGAATAALVNIPIRAPQMITNISSIIQNPEILIENPFALPMMVIQLGSILDNLNNMIKETPKVIKNVAANIEILKAILAADKERTEQKKLEEQQQKDQAEADAA